MILRGHQEQAINIGNRIASDPAVPRLIVADIVPGGGKSALPIIFGHCLIGKIVDKVCWVVPRDALRVQAERAFHDKRWRKLLGHSLEARASVNDINPSRDTAGYITTYQAIAADPDLHADEFKRHRYLLVLDEPHHVSVGEAFERSLEQIANKAMCLVLMSGTFERHDFKRIAFIRYIQDLGDPTSWSPQLNQTPTQWSIRYTRQDALREEAILPLDFERIDARAGWTNRLGEDRKRESFIGAAEETPAMLFTALNNEYAVSLLAECLKHWQDHKAHVNPRSKLLVVAPNINRAQHYLKYLRSCGMVEECDIAVSEDDKAAKENIERFRGIVRPEINVLVTVAMAYEGLDVPQATHLACLTHIRSKPWLEQMLARVNRVDYEAGSWEEQRGYIWAPDDELFSQCIQQIQIDQDAALWERPAKEREKPAEIREPENIVPLFADATEIRSEELDGGLSLDAQSTARLKKVMQAHGIKGCSVTQFKRAVDAVAQAVDQAAVDQLDELGDVLTPSEREKKLRVFIDRKIKRACRGDGELIASWNKALIRRFGKPRPDMGEAELRLVWKYLCEHLPGADDEHAA